MRGKRINEPRTGKGVGTHATVTPTGGLLVNVICARMPDAHELSSPVLSKMQRVGSLGMFVSICTSFCAIQDRNSIFDTKMDSLTLPYFGGIEDLKTSTSNYGQTVEDGATF